MRDLQERLLTFSISIILFLRKVPFNEEYKIIKRQLIRSSTSAGANYEESQGGYSRADFSFKVATSLKEMRESVYWLKILKGIITDEELRENCQDLISESTELKNILGAICAKLMRVK